MMTSPPRRLPFWRTLIDAHVETIENFPELSRLAWPWMAALMVVMAGLHWILWPIEQHIAESGRAGSYSALILPTLLPLLLGAFVAVPWHRAVLRGEALDSTSGFRLTPISLRYFAWAVWLAMFWLVPIIIIYALTDLALVTEGAGATGESSTALADRPVDTAVADADTPTAGRAWLFPFYLLAWIVVAFVGPLALLLYIPTRLTLILPAIALDQPLADTGTIWRATRGNFWRLYFGSGLTLSIPMTLYFLQYAIEGEPQTRHAYVASHVTSDAIFFITGMIAITYLSLAYRYLVLGIDLPETSSSD